MTVTVEQARSSLKELIEKSVQGESVVITEGNIPVAEIRSGMSTKPVPVIGSCKQMLTVLSDDDDHLADFSENLK